MKTGTLGGEKPKIKGARAGPSSGTENATSCWPDDEASRKYFLSSYPNIPNAECPVNRSSGHRRQADATTKSDIDGFRRDGRARDDGVRSICCTPSDGTVMAASS